MAFRVTVLGPLTLKKNLVHLKVIYYKLMYFIPDPLDPSKIDHS